MTDDFKAIADAMKNLGLERDRPFSTPLEKDFHAELNEKLKHQLPEPEVDWYSGC